MIRKDMKCKHCKSTLIEPSPWHFECTGDNLPVLLLEFDNILALELDTRKMDNPFNNKLTELSKENSKLLKMFLKFRKAKAKNKKAKVVCPFNDLFKPKVFLDDSETTIPGPSDSMKIGDPAEGFLAEHMLGRRLTEDESSGKDPIPKIKQTDGSIFWGSITEIVWPHDCNTYNKNSEPDDRNELIPIFDFKAIKNKFKTPTIKRKAA
jgi:hypothetical protein